MSKVVQWQPLNTMPQNGDFVLVEHPDSSIPAIARPIGPGSMTFELYWGGGIFEVQPYCVWMPLPELP